MSPKYIKYYFRRFSDNPLKVEKVDFNIHQFNSACEKFGYTYPFMNGIDENLALKLINEWNNGHVFYSKETVAVFWIK